MKCPFCYVITTEDGQILQCSNQCKDKKNFTGSQTKKEQEKWYEKPENICGKCGYHKNTCVCKIQKKYQN